MRILLIPSLMALLLAGCTTPDAAEPDPLFGVCPQWQQGSDVAPIGVQVALGEGGTEVPVDQWADTPTLDGHPLDMYRFRLDNLTLDGTLQLRVFADGRQLGIHDFRDPGGPRLMPVLTLDGGSDVDGKEFQVLLSPVEHGSEPAPSSVRFDFDLPEGQADLQLAVTAHYRVCGAVIE